jgi:hypothetical protein
MLLELAGPKLLQGNKGAGVFENLPGADYFGIDIVIVELYVWECPQFLY